VEIVNVLWTLARCAQPADVERFDPAGEKPMIQKSGGI
jgi:hypothetical protein